MDDKLFKKAASSLKENELFHGDNFSLADETSSIDNEDIRSYNIGRNTTLLSPLQRDLSGIVIYEFNINNLFYLFNEINCLEFVELHAYPYPQTLPTIIYCNEVILSKLYKNSFYNTKNTLTEQCFYAGCLYLFIILSFRSIYLNELLIKKGGVFFEGDDYIFLNESQFADFEKKCDEEQIQHYYRQYELIMKESEEIYNSLLVKISNIKILNTFITMKKIYGDTIKLMININNTSINLKTNAIQQRCVYILSYFNDIKNSIPLCEILDGAIDPDLSLFVKYSFNKMELPDYNYEDIYDEWKDMINKYISVYKLVMSNKSNLFLLYSQMKSFFSESNSILIRSYVSILYNEFVEKQFIMSLEDSFHLPDDFFRYDNGEIIFYSLRSNMNDYFKLYCFTVPRHLTKVYLFIVSMSNFIRELVNYYEILKTSNPVVFKKNEKHYLLLLYYLYGIVCECSKDYIEDIFKLKLHEEYETYMLCWFIDYAVSRIVCYYNKIIEYFNRIKQEEIEMKRIMNPDKVSKSNNSNNNNSYNSNRNKNEDISHFKNEIFYYETLQLVYRGIFQVLLGLRIKGILTPLITVYGNEESRYYKRLELFKGLEEPGLVDYKVFSEGTSPDKVKFEDLIQISLNTFKTAKSYISKLLELTTYTRKEELIHLQKISSGNIVSIMKYSSTYDSVNVELDYSFSKVFPVVRFK